VPPAAERPPLDFSSLYTSESDAPTEQKTQRRKPLPSDPWMAQVGGVDKLSSAHLASAQRSYEAWPLKNRYDLKDYVSYVQRQWENKELPPAPQVVAPQPPKTKYEPTPPKPADWTKRELTEEFKGLQPPPQPEPPKREGEPPKIYQLRREIWQQQVLEMAKHAEANAEEYKQAEAAAKNANASKLEDFDIQQREARQAAQERLQPEPKTGWRAALDRILNLDDEEKKAAERSEQLELLQARQAQERLDYIKKLEQDRDRELEALRARQLRQQADREKAYDADLERQISEKKRAIELQREMEAKPPAEPEAPVPEIYTQKPPEGWTERKLAEEFKGLEAHKPQPPLGWTERKLDDEFKKADPDAERHQREKKRALELRHEMEAEPEPKAPAPVLAPPPAPAETHTPKPPEGWTERKVAEEFKKTDPDTERHQREKKRAAELRAELEAEDREKQLNKEKEDELSEGKG
jgi:hypothetical protein